MERSEKLIYKQQRYDAELWKDAEWLMDLPKARRQAQRGPARPPASAECSVGGVRGRGGWRA